MGVGLPAVARGLPTAANPQQLQKGVVVASHAIALTLGVGLHAAARGLPPAAHPQQLHKGVVAASHEGRFHKSLPAVTAAAAVALGVSLLAAAPTP